MSAQPPVTLTSPFAHVLVPYDGSDAARAALSLAIALGHAGAKVAIVNVVDETAAIAQTANAFAPYDPTSVLDALDAEGNALLAEATARCRAEHIDASAKLVHEQPVPGILAACEQLRCDLVIMGTHGRRGLARAFLGSSAVGVLRAGALPVLTVRSGEHLSPAPFAAPLVAADDSEPAAAALALAAAMIRTSAAAVTIVHAVDTTRPAENAATFGFGLEPLRQQLYDDAIAMLQPMLDRARLPAGTPLIILEGPPAATLRTAAAQRAATVIVTGTHGRRGLRRFVLGSVAETLVRTSDIPVLVVPAPTPLHRAFALKADPK